MVSVVLYSSKILLMIMTGTFHYNSFSVSHVPAPFHPSFLSNPHDNSAKYLLFYFLSCGLQLIREGTRIYTSICQA